MPFLDVWLYGQEERFQRKVKKIFEQTAVDRRYAIMSPEEVFNNTSFEEKNDIYVREVKKLGIDVLRKALEKSNWEGKSNIKKKLEKKKEEKKNEQAKWFVMYLCT